MPDRRHSAWAFRLAIRRGGAASQQTVVDELRRVILDGAVPPGTPIPVGEVADLFGVSHIPVRESLMTLTSEGLVTHQRNVGYSVARLTVTELAEMYVVRETLESAALAAAVVRATDADRAHVIHVNQLLELAVSQDDSQSYHRQSRVFHMGLARPSGMLRLMHMLESAWNVTEPVQAMVHVAPVHRARLHEDHGEMLDAFLTGDAERLLACSAAHHRLLNEVVATLPADTGLIVGDG
ncbi:GntR family transcriptional regulator [Mycolicibacterium madagascariense]|uniref:GntR family transcriptional regulator n=1 Tax=Mycolicibacterium madagascariense TaxID=212765 RepID=A0A7I7XN85_9MYCO|nr:GntR family transcriptional regulator [Mycolicibacterium madagascariense]MCV7015641.1 GntR family transcriptional regulator [Mycolicibacterium madagascariense]BBZ30697.1 GntR family transcriptional regulator [Mycolicibacterium madagascariense]